MDLWSNEFFKYVRSFFYSRPLKGQTKSFKYNINTKKTETFKYHHTILNTNMKQKTKTIKITDTIPYQPIHPQYGRAEFQICPVYKNGYIKQVHIYRQQQTTNETYILHIDKGIKINTFSITAWTHKTEPPSIWRESWCKDHKTITHEVYVPDNTNKISFAYHFGNTLDIRFE